MADPGSGLGVLQPRLDNKTARTQVLCYIIKSIQLVCNLLQESPSIFFINTCPVNFLPVAFQKKKLTICLANCPRELPCYFTLVEWDNLTKLALLVVYIFKKKQINVFNNDFVLFQSIQHLFLITTYKDSTLLEWNFNYYHINIQRAHVVQANLLVLYNISNFYKTTFNITIC